MRVLAVDLGTKRIGLALSDPTGTIASPLLVITRKGGKADLREIVEIARDYEVGEIVVGLPVDLRGEQGVAAQRAQGEIDELRGLSPVPVQVYDERLTSAAAQKALSAGGLDTRGQRGVVDKVAAALLLQSYLDRKRQQDASQEAQE